MEDRIADDARAALRAKVRQARAMTAEERMLSGPRLFAGVCERMKEGLRDDFPGCDEQEIHHLLIRRITKLRKLDEIRTPFS